MKHTITLLLSFSLLGLLLTGCEQFIPMVQESRTPRFQPTPSPVQTEMPFPTNPVESGASSAVDNIPSGESPSNLEDLFSFPAFPEGNYLADPKFDTEEYLPDYDADLAFLQNETSAYTSVCETSDTIYFLPDTSQKYREPAFLQYYDIASGKTMVLCNKPECTHTDISCNACLSSDYSVFGLRIYDNKLYWIGTGSYGLSLMRMNLDGTEHETVTVLDYKVANKAIYNVEFTTWVIHRGYIYIAGAAHDCTSRLEPYECFVYAIPFDGGEATLVASCVQTCSSAICFIAPQGNDLYISFNFATSSKGELGTAADGAVETCHCINAFYRWNSKTRKAECLYAEDCDLKDSLAYFSLFRPYPVSGDGLYYFLWRVTVEEDVFRFMKLSFQSGEIDEIGIYPGDGDPYLANNYIFSRANNDDFQTNIYTYDYNFNSVLQESYSNIGIFSNFYGANSRHAFYLYYDGTHYNIAVIPLNGGEMLFLKALDTEKKPGKTLPALE